jgi:uncharacterized DUF497 family protein
LGVDWDTYKSISNVEKHEISFRDAINVFSDPSSLTINVSKPDYGEDGYKTIGMTDGLITTVVFTWRDDLLRIISARRRSRSVRETTTI